MVCCLKFKMLMSEWFTLANCPLTQSALPSLAHQRGETEYTGFSTWLKAPVWICRTELQQSEQRCQSRAK